LLENVKKIHVLFSSEEQTNKLNNAKLSYKSFIDEARFEVDNVAMAKYNKDVELYELKSSLEWCEIILSQVMEVIREIKEKIAYWDLVRFRFRF